MSLFGFLFAAGAGGLVSILPLLCWYRGPGMDRQIWMNILGHLLALPVLVTLLVLLGRAPADPQFLLVAALAGVCSGINGTIYYAAVIPRGPMAISWAIIWSSAVIVAAAGWALLGDPIYATQPIALLAFLGCLIVMG
ncbi:MAG: hypothetical protein PHU85_01380, partial [Phycisphaerae bacterium]|nr:hypothetical protein [Phycisphaerae bacterium]